MSDQDLIQNAALVTKYDEVMDTTPVVMQSKQFELNAMQFQNLNILMDILRISPFKSGQVSCLEMAATPSCKLQVVYLPDLSNAEPEVLLNQIDELLFERLMLDNETVKKNLIEVEVTIVKRKSECNASEAQQLFYLYQCYHRLHEAEASVGTELGLAIRKSIVNQTASYLCQPVIYPCQDTTPGLLLKLMDKYYADYGHYDVLQAFLEATATEIQQRNKDGDDAADLIAILIDGYYKKLVSRLSGCSLVGHQLFASLSLVKLIASTPTLSQSFIILNSPWKARSNYDFKVGLGGKSASEDVMNSLLGRLLSTSCLLSQGETVPEFFVTPSRSSHHEHQVTERNIGVQLKRLTEEIHQLFLGLLRNKVTKNEILNWIGLVLYAFKDRSKMWTNEMIMSTGTSIQTSDGFMLNFSNVLLLLCRPFSEAYSPKLLKIDPRYCSSPALPLDKTLGDMNGINIRSLSEETFIIQNPVEAEDSTAREQSVNQYNFMTEIFYAAHKALQIGFRSCHERFLRLASDMNHIQRVYEEARMQSMQGNEMLERLQEQMDKGMAQFLSMKAMLSQSDTVELMLQFHIATATWLNNLSISESADDASHGFKKITKSVLGLDGTANVKNCLDAIPEFIVDNISDMVTFVRRFSDKTLTLPNLSLEPLMTLIIIFMGCSDKMKNPHSRARLAEVLECLMPRTESEYPGQMNYSSSYDVTKKLFTEHPLADELTPTLLNVFVSIEMTGQSVAFEQKFQYRRPMYLVLKYLCTEVTDPHRKRMKELAIYAEEHIEAGDAPLFCASSTFSSTTPFSCWTKGSTT
ncbi:Ubiquitin conjugation factor E4 A [Halotydeus destructor]|nr:Ubiquitin conjugation factor E4 A [Halotydeus destructor]